MKKISIFLAISAVMGTASSIALASPDAISSTQLPVVPVSTIAQSNNNSAQVVSPAPASTSGAVSSVSNQVKGNVLSITPRVNEIIPIATGHPNRFTTPFENPMIRTTSSATFDVAGRDLYVSSRDEGRPITAFINDEGNPDLTLSVTFVPQRIPPVDLQLEIDSSVLASGVNPNVSVERAQSWEESNPYITTLRNLLRDVATGETPSGYSLSEMPYIGGTPDCFQPGLNFDFVNGQTLDGHRLRVSIGVIENISSEIIEFREPACAGDDVRAVAAWPNPLLAPGEKTEVYVVRSIAERHQVTRGTRRSLIN